MRLIPTGRFGWLVLVVAILTITDLPSGIAYAESRIVFLGDSLTHGFGVRSEESFPALLGESLRKEGYEDVTVVNAGLDGATTADGRERLQSFLFPKPHVL